MTRRVGTASTLAPCARSERELTSCGPSLSLFAGEVLALTGENGAGKSTLSKIVCGLVPPSEGRMAFLAAPYAPRSRADAERQGVRMVMQELNLLPTLTIAENLFLSHLPSAGGWIRRGSPPRHGARGHGAHRPRRARSRPAGGAARHRPPADGGDRPQPHRRLPAARSRRAHRHAHLAGGRAALRADPPAQAGGPGGGLHLPPPRGAPPPPSRTSSTRRGRCGPRPGRG